MKQTIINLKTLTKYYGKARGVEEVNLEIKKGEIFGFIGPNGAGKSTTIRCIMNLINKNKGEIFVDNQEVTKKNVSIKEEIGYLPSEIYLYDDLTVEKMIQYSDSFYKKDCIKRAEELIKRFEIDRKKKIDELSLGNLKKVGIVLTFMHEPKVFILDEATSGLDPLMQEVFYELLEEERKKGTTIFFSSHNLSEVKRICDRVGIIREGKIVAVNKIEELTSSNFYIITIISEEKEKIKQELKSQIISEKNNILKVMYDNDINELIKQLGKYKLSKLMVEEPSIEEIFMHYYK